MKGVSWHENMYGAENSRILVENLLLGIASNHYFGIYYLLYYRKKLEYFFQLSCPSLKSPWMGSVAKKWKLPEVWKKGDGADGLGIKYDYTLV